MPASLHTCMEATGRYHEALAFFLYQQGYMVSVVNPARTKAYAASQLSRNKNDRLDAKVIAHFCATQQPPLWTPPSPQLRTLRDLVRHLQALKDMRQQQINRLQAGDLATEVVSALSAHIAFIEEQIKEMELKIQALINSNPEFSEQKELLISIVGIGEVTAATILAEIGEIRAFESAGQLAAYLGLTPQNRSSGTSVRRRGRMSKKGNGRLRKALYFPAIVGMRFNPILKEFSERLLARGKGKMVVIGAVMRKMAHLIYGVLKHKSPFDPAYGG